MEDGGWEDGREEEGWRRGRKGRGWWLDGWPPPQYSSGPRPPASTSPTHLTYIFVRGASAAGERRWSRVPNAEISEPLCPAVVRLCTKVLSPVFVFP